MQKIKLLLVVFLFTFCSVVFAHKQFAAEVDKKFQNYKKVAGILDALKLLQKNYFERVKMIYIDPPYNTQNDNFIYRDNFTKTQEEVLDELGYDKEQKEYIKNIAGAKTHSGWLSFIYPRLLLARELLRDDGVIFISIDDNEQANLKLLCDEVFGEMNFVGEFSWKGKSGSSDDDYLKVNNEYIVFYTKNKDSFIIGREELAIKENDFRYYDEKKQISYKRQLARKWGDNSNREDRPNLFYSVLAPDGTKIFPIKISENNKEGRWRWKKDLLKEKKDNNDLEFIKDQNKNWILYEKIYKPDNSCSKKIFNTLIENIQSNGTKYIKDLFGFKIFSNPKTPDLISVLLKVSNSFEDDIILDFFAGSGTTGDAVMRLNAEDGGNRKYVLVQLDEPIKKKNNKEAYDFVKNELKKEPTIFEIAAERLRRAGAKIEQTQQEKPQELAQEKSTLDTGFKIFALAKDKNNEIHRIKHSEQKQISTELTNSTIQNETLLYNMLLGAGITFQEKIHCLIKNTCYQAKEHLFILQQFSLGKKNEASKENEAILEKASAEYAHIYNRNITDDEFILNLTKFIKKEKITLKEPL